jgi:hypothetical protein
MLFSPKIQLLFLYLGKLLCNHREEGRNEVDGGLVCYFPFLLVHDKTVELSV